ncbi:MAG: DUF1905 domain-containing protein [Chthonomonas sp.]|nr:DUF1905 domain-containing protein [Chthonomonas sp.]
MEWEFEGKIVEWRGPPPYLFVPAPIEVGAEIKSVAHLLTYGWGCIPATVEVGENRVDTALFPKDGSYFVPIKVALQRAAGLELGDTVSLRLSVAVSLS